MNIHTSRFSFLHFRGIFLFSYTDIMYRLAMHQVSQNGFIVIQSIVWAKYQDSIILWVKFKISLLNGEESKITGDSRSQGKYTDFTDLPWTSTHLYAASYFMLVCLVWAVMFSLESVGTLKHGSVCDGHNTVSIQSHGSRPYIIAAVLVWQTFVFLSCTAPKAN